MLIHIARGQQTLGAFDVAELKRKIDAGDISLDDLAWTEGDAEWSTLSSLAALKSISLDTPKSQALTTQIGSAILSVGGVIAGTVAHSKHDRVGIVQGGGSGSYGCSMYKGTGSANASFSFEISTEIDVRHEFWLRQEDGLETQFVFPTHMPLADNQVVRMSSLCLSGSVVGIYLQNLTSNKSYVFVIAGERSGTVIEDDGTPTAFASLTSGVFQSAFATEGGLYAAYPEMILGVKRPPDWLFNLTMAILAVLALVFLYGGYRLWTSNPNGGWGRLITVPIGPIIGFAVSALIVTKITGFVRYGEKLEAHEFTEKSKIVATGYRELVKIR